MRKLTIAAAAAVLLSTAPVMTVTNGTPDGNRHPYVGLALQAAPGGGSFVCTGSFLSPTTFLTAAHRFDPTHPALVPPPAAPPLQLAAIGVVHNNPDWCLGCGS